MIDARLDTHTVIWFFQADPRLSGAAKALIEDPSNRKLVSVASCGEIAIKFSIGKLSLHPSYEEFLDVRLNRYRFQLMVVEPVPTSRVARSPFPPGHEDPFACRDPWIGSRSI